jgi:Family of unknown function (DUF6174)
MAQDSVSSTGERTISAADSLETSLAAADNRGSRRGLWIAIGIVALAVAAVLIGVKLLVNPMPALTEARLVEAEELWQRAGPATYDMDLEIRGAQPGQVHIEVRNGEVTAMTRDGHTPPQRTWDTWTVPGQFETLDRELVIAEDPEHEMQAQAGTQFRVRAEFDPQYGYPRRYHRYVSGGGPEVFWQVTEFQPK